MFKRVDRRRKRQEQAESLGLDEDEKDILGLHDTDSSESESDSSASAVASSSSTSLDGRVGHKRKRRASLPSNDEEKSENGELVTEDEEDEDDGDSDHGTDPSLTIASALQDPIRLIYQHPEAWACAFCPNKILKHTAMVKVHEASRIHRQRLKRLQELAMEFSPNDNIQKLLIRSTTKTQPKGEGTTLSRRAELRRAKQAKLKERRKKIKEKKAVAIVNAKGKKAAKTEEKEAIQVSAFDANEPARPLKRVKIPSNSGRESRVHRTSPHRKKAGLTTEVARKSREAMKCHVPGKSKKPRADEDAVSA